MIKDAYAKADAGTQLQRLGEINRKLAQLNERIGTHEGVTDYASGRLAERDILKAQAQALNSLLNPPGVAPGGDFVTKKDEKTDVEDLIEKDDDEEKTVVVPRGSACPKGQHVGFYHGPQAVCVPDNEKKKDADEEGDGDGMFKVEPGRKNNPIPPGEGMGGFTMVQGVTAKNIQKGESAASRPPSSKEIPIEAEATASASGGELIYSGGRGLSDRQMMSGRVAISGLGAGRGLRLSDFPASETKGIDPESLRKILDLMRSAENKEKLKDWVGMEDEAKKALEEALKTKTPDDAPKLFSKIYLLFATALIKQSDETPGLSREERMAKYA